LKYKTNDNISGELGPLKYLSGLTGFPMDRIINWLLLTIIFVFDPLAIALVIAANFAFDQVKSKKTNFISQAIKVIQPKKVKMSVPEGMEFNKSYPIPQDDGEERMNIIGQNGNDGLHYDELTDAEKKLDLNKDGILDQFELDRDAKIESLKLMKVNGDRDSQWVENEIANLPTKPPLT
tara:strand:+ start:374 stop:910 length:537 start_codon:yes stop_codon:yes gene_type:complete